MDNAKRPDLHPLIVASYTLGRYLKSGALVVYESMAYPGCREQVAVSPLEEASGLQAGCDFAVGYSLEHNNPGDQEHTLETATKIVVRQDTATTERVATLYEHIVRAGCMRTTKSARSRPSRPSRKSSGT